MIGLGRAVRAITRSTPPSPAQEIHRTTNWLREVILGGQDGLVNMLGIALGVISAGGSTHVLIVTGWAAAVTESLSMGAVAYTSYSAERDYYRAERDLMTINEPSARKPVSQAPGRKSRTTGLS